MATRFIADMHLYHAYSEDWRSDLQLGLDGYANMLLREWNSGVDVNDTVIIVGDIGKYCEMTENVLRRLNGQKILVLGNHDLEWGSKLYDSTLFAGVHTSILTNGVYIQHKPDFSDNVRNKCTYLVHGHHHRYDMPNMRQALQLYARDVHRYNCAADLIKHKPRTLQELMLQKELLLERYYAMNLL